MKYTQAMLQQPMSIIIIININVYYINKLDTTMLQVPYGTRNNEADENTTRIGKSLYSN